MCFVQPNRSSTVIKELYFKKFIFSSAAAFFLQYAKHSYATHTPKLRGLDGGGH